jgi:hypothetical protein
MFGINLQNAQPVLPTQVGQKTRWINHLLIQSRNRARTLRQRRRPRIFRQLHRLNLQTGAGADHRQSALQRRRSPQVAKRRSQACRAQIGLRLTSEASSPHLRHPADCAGRWRKQPA